MTTDDTKSHRPSTRDPRREASATELWALHPGALVTSWTGDTDGAFSPMSGAVDEAR